METFDQAVKQIALDVAELVISKQKDYGQDNILQSPFGADKGIVVRWWDKFARLKNLLNTNSEPKNESIDDTVIDIIGYGLIYKMVRDGTFTLPLEETPVVKIKPSWKPEPSELEIV